MQSQMRDKITQGFYQVGLNCVKEDVISAHFMHGISSDLRLSLYSPEEFYKASFEVSSKSLNESLIPALLEASHKFIMERVSSAKKRAIANFKEYGLSSASDIGLAETIVEVFFDRQFLKGSKTNISRALLRAKVAELLANNKPIKMVIPALPYKSSSPLKSRGTLPELSEVNFLLGLIEIAKTIDFIYRESRPELQKPMSMFTVVCDGTRFNKFLNEPDESIHEYQHYLCKWIKRLGIADFIEIVDYQHVISHCLEKDLQDEKIGIGNRVYEKYKNIMLSILSPSDMRQTITNAIELDPDPEESNKEGRFVPLFKSLIYIIKYETLSKYTALHRKDYLPLYRELTAHIFEPYADLAEQDFKKILDCILKPGLKTEWTEAQIMECLRLSMIYEAWEATIKYISEIKSDRDLLQEPIATCFPEHIRWTIHAKPGQLAILTTTVFGDPVQPWHGAAVFKLSKQNRIKLYTLPALSLEGMGAKPVLLSKEESLDSELKEYAVRKQPLFYVYPDLKFEDMQDFFNQLRNRLTRSRKS